MVVQSTEQPIVFPATQAVTWEIMSIGKMHLGSSKRNLEWESSYLGITDRTPREIGGGRIGVELILLYHSTLYLTSPRTDYLTLISARGKVVSGTRQYKLVRSSENCLRQWCLQSDQAERSGPHAGHPPGEKN